MAYLLAAGPGDRSRIYKTEDGGRTWALQFTNRDTSAFYDCFAFWDPRRGFTMSDAVAGASPWSAPPTAPPGATSAATCPRRRRGEAAFAASGTCTAVLGERHGWIATGAAARARVLATTDGGESWRATATPIVQGTPASGGSSIDVPRHAPRHPGRRQRRGAGFVRRQRGPFRRRRAAPGSSPADPVPRRGLRPGYAGTGSRTVVATGPGGAAWSADEGERWTSARGVKTTGRWPSPARPRAGWWAPRAGSSSSRSSATLAQNACSSPGVRKRARASAAKAARTSSRVANGGGSDP